MSQVVTEDLPIIMPFISSDLTQYPQFYNLNDWFAQRFNLYIWIGNIAFIPFVLTYEILLKDFTFWIAILSNDLNYIINNLTGYNFFGTWLSYTATSWAIFFRFITETSGYFFFQTILSTIHVITLPFTVWDLLFNLDSVSTYVASLPSDYNLTFTEGTQFHYFYGIATKLVTRWASATSWLLGVTFDDTLLALSGIIIDPFLLPLIYMSYAAMAICINYDKDSWNNRYTEF